VRNRLGAIRLEIVGGNRQASALAVLRQILDDIAAMEPSPAKTAAIRELAEALQELYGTATAIRKAEVLRIQEAEKLTLAQLAGRVGISKARADQIVKAEERRQKEARDA
jgi:hypothetical protein